MTVFSGPTGPKILLTQNQVIMPYPVPQNDFLHDRSANADRSHMTVFSGPTGPKISLTGNQVIMPYPVRFRTVGDGFPVPPSAPQVRRIWFCTNSVPHAVNGMGRADVGIGPYDVMPCLLRRDDHWSSGTFRHAHIRLFLQTATFRTANGRPYMIAPQMRIDRI